MKKIRSVHRCASNFCQNLGEASELATHAQHVASALGVYSAQAERTQSAHVKKSPRMHSVWLAHGTNGPRMQRALNAQPANGSSQMTVPIKSDGLPSYRSREETRHTRVIQHANQERKCDVSESDEDYSCSYCWSSQ